MLRHWRDEEIAWDELQRQCKRKRKTCPLDNDSESLAKEGVATKLGFRKHDRTSKAKKQKLVKERISAAMCGSPPSSKGGSSRRAREPEPSELGVGDVSVVTMLCQRCDEQKSLEAFSRQ